MKIIDEIGDAFNIVSRKAVKAYDFKRLNMKVKAYEKEVEQLYKRVGRSLYEACNAGREPDSAQLTEYMESIANIHFRINQLNKTISEMKSQTAQDAKTSADSKEITAYAKLSRKENDLKIGRTSEGIRILRNCPNCKTPNSSKAEACESCGAEFS